MNVDYRSNDDPNNNCCGIAPDKNKVIKIREYYFDEPITVKDSFYVGHTTYNNLWAYPGISPYDEWNFESTCWSVFFRNPNEFSNCPQDQMKCDTFPLMQYKFKQDEFQMPRGLKDSSIWYYFNEPYFTIEFPIIEIDSSFYDGPPQYVCPQVQNFRIAQAAEGTVVFFWDTHGDHQRWQMSYGPAGTEPDDGTIVNCPMQVGQIMGLDTCTDYVAYIRAVCNHDSIVYSEWSAPLAFNICDTTGGGTAAIEGGLGQYIQLFPLACQRPGAADVVVRAAQHRGLRPAGAHTAEHPVRGAHGCLRCCRMAQRYVCRHRQNQCWQLRKKDCRFEKIKSKGNCPTYQKKFVHLHAVSNDGTACKIDIY